MVHPSDRWTWARAAAVLAVLGSGCAGDYVARTRGLRDAYEADRYDQASRGFAGEAKDGPAIDKLLALMDQGMVLHASGKYRESTRALAQADRLSEQLDVTSISEEAEVFLTSERKKAYRGEDFEKLMISVVQALNHAQLGQDEDALVEARRVNERMLKMIREEKKPYEQLAIARYLAGALWEDTGHLDDAFIDYASADELTGELGSLAEPLLRLAKATGREDAYASLRRRYPAVGHEPLGATEGQLLVVLEAGRVPEKIDGTWHGKRKAEVIAVPVFKDRPWKRGAARISLDRGTPVTSTTVTSLERVSKIHLNDRLERMIAKQSAASSLREGLSAGAGGAAHSNVIAKLTSGGLDLMNEPDLRSWLSLPAEFELARFRGVAGHHELAVAVGGRQETCRVDLKPQRITLLVLRTY